MKKRFIIMDPGLKNFCGHNWSYNSLIADSLIKDGFEVMIVANYTCKPIKSIMTIPLFRVDTACDSIYVGRIRRFSRSIKNVLSDFFNKKIFPFWILPSSLIPYIGRFVAKSKMMISDGISSDLLFFFKNNNVSSYDHILITDITFPILCELWWTLLSLETGCVPKITIIFHHDLLLGKLRMRYFFLKRKVLSSFIQINILQERVNFLVTTKELQKQYEHCLSVKTIPAPHQYAVPNTSTQKTAMIKIAYLGSGRIEKGFHCLEFLLPFFKRKNLTNIHFLIQISLGDEKLDDLFYQKYTSYSFVSAYKGPLSHERYFDLLNQSNIVLFPYSPVSYRAKLSGILVEAIGSEKVTVVPEGSSLASLAKRGGSISYTEEALLPLAVERAIRNYKTLEEKARVYGPVFRSLHNPQRFLESVTQYCINN